MAEDKPRVNGVGRVLNPAIEEYALCGTAVAVTFGPSLRQRVGMGAIEEVDGVAACADDESVCEGASVGASECLESSSCEESEVESVEDVAECMLCVEELT